MTKLWTVVLITNPLVIRLNVVLVLSLDVVKEDPIILLYIPREMGTVVHLVGGDLLERPIVELLLSFVKHLSMTLWFILVN